MIKSDSLDELRQMGQEQLWLHFGMMQWKLQMMLMSRHICGAHYGLNLQVLLLFMLQMQMQQNLQQQ